MLSVNVKALSSTAKRYYREVSAMTVSAHQTTSVTLTWALKNSSPKFPAFDSLRGRHDDRINEILKVFLPQPDNVLSQSQQIPTHTTNSVGGMLKPPAPEAVFPITPFQVSLLCTCTLKSPRRTTKSPVGAPYSTSPKDYKKTGYSVLLL